MKRALALLALVAAPALAAPSTNRAKVRLAPDDIATLQQRAGGVGTSGVAGIRTVILAGDPTEPGPYTIELRVPAHTRIAAHTHRDDRSAVVVSGTWYFGYGTVATLGATKALAPGSFYTEPAGDAHFAITRDQPVTLIISGFGPTDTQFL
jgi:quercetin dioxygenase-like cupin family protein